MKIQIARVIKASAYFAFICLAARYAICVYYDRKTQDYLKSHNIYFNHVEGPPKNWQPPWRWNMIEYISVGLPRDNNLDIYIDHRDVSEVIGLSTQLCCLLYLQVTPPVHTGDIKNLKKLDALQYLQISTQDENFPKYELAKALPHTDVIVNGQRLSDKSNRD